MSHLGQPCRKSDRDLTGSIRQFETPPQFRSRQWAVFLQCCTAASAYGLCLVTLLYAIGFAGNLVVPKSIDSGAAGPLDESVVVNVMLLGLFAVQHSVMARPGFKRWWTRIVPPLGRAQHLCVVCQPCAAAPVLAVAADPRSRLGRAAIRSPWPRSTRSTGSAGACCCVSTFLISHFELFGLSQVFARLLGRELPAAEIQRAAAVPACPAPDLSGLPARLLGHSCR